MALIWRSILGFSPYKRLTFMFLCHLERSRGLLYVRSRRSILRSGLKANLRLSMVNFSVLSRLMNFFKWKPFVKIQIVRFFRGPEICIHSLNLTRQDVMVEVLGEG